MKVIKILVHLYFLSNGIIFTEKYGRYEPYLRAVVFTNNGILIVGLLMAFSQARKIIHKIQIGSVICCVIGVLIFKIIAHIRKKQLLLTTSKLLEDSKFDIKHITYNVESKMMKKFAPLIIGVIFSFFVLFNVTFLAFFTNSEISYNDMDIYIVPELFVFSSVDSFGEYLKIIWLQTALFFPEMIAYLSLTTYTCYVVASFEVHIEEIYYLTETFIHFANVMMSRITKTVQQKSLMDENPRINSKVIRRLAIQQVRQKFQRLIQLQQYNFHYVNDFISFGKWVFNAMLAWFFCTLVLFIFITTQVTNDRVLLAKVSAVVLNFLFVFYILCYSGEVIHEASGSIVIQLYNAKWYTLQPSLRKWVFLLMQVTQNHVQVKAFNMYTIDLNLYTKTLKIVFSFVNGILLMQKK